MNKKNYLFILILLGLILANLWLWQNSFWGIILGFIYLFYFGKKLGGWLLGSQDKIFRFFYGFLLLLSLISFLGSIIYLIYKLDNLAISLTLVLLALIINKLCSKEEKLNEVPEKEENPNPLSLPYLILVLVYLTIILSLFSFLSAHATTEAIRSPWQLMPQKFFSYYFLATFILLAIIWQDRQRKMALGLIILHYLFSVNVAVVVYKLGYGFDSLIHQATEKGILTSGVIFPKKLFYLGQYALVVILSKLLAVDFIFIDKILVPFGFALFLPPLIYYSLTRALNFEKKEGLLISLSFLAWPFSSFIVTTPQNLANLYLLLALFFGFLYLKNKINFWPLLILTVSTLFIHPLAGIPLVVLAILLFLKKYFQNNQKIAPRNEKIILLCVLLLFSFSLPILFFLNYLIQSGFVVALKQMTASSALIKTFEWLRFSFINQFNFPYDLIYFYKINFYFLVFALMLLSLYFFRQRFSFLASFLLAFVVTFVNFIFLRLFIFFAFVISYEQSDYSQRVLEISFYFFLPFIAYLSYLIIKKIEKEKIFYKLFWGLMLAGFITASFYVTYPRDDDYQTNPGYNLSLSDIKAVRYIAKEAKSPYIVLANQQVSAAAIKEFGFINFYPLKIDEKETYHQFYYPVPTSSPLYTYYLSMVYDNHSEEIMAEAMQLVGAKEAYFVINRYWWRFDKIVREAKKTANGWQSIDNEKIYIFKYTLK